MRRAFTLIELLVVIAIISLLVSILLPSLNKAKDQAALLTCLARLKRCHTGAMFYMEDNSDIFPPAVWHGGNNSAYPNCGVPEESIAYFVIPYLDNDKDAFICPYSYEFFQWGYKLSYYYEPRLYQSTVNGTYTLTQGTSIENTNTTLMLWSRFNNTSEAYVEITMPHANLQKGNMIYIDGHARSTSEISPATSYARPDDYLDG